MSDLRIDGDRLWRTLMDLATIGATPKGGLCRLALTDLDREGRDLFVRWCEEAGCTVTVDEVGNIFARRAGRNPDRPAVCMGSHLDTQPTGGRFDGIYGVLAGLEVIRSFNDQGIETDAPIDLIVWTNEEGARFSPPMLGSGVAMGVFTLDHVLDIRDTDGVRLGDELARIGYKGEVPVTGHAMGAYFEAHIEQGPVLEAEDVEIGVVTGAQGQRWYEATVTGRESHAGPTPMRLRRDALAGAAVMMEAVEAIALEVGGDACSTIGRVQVHPDSRNVIPGRVWFTIDLRNPDPDALARMDALLRERLAAIADKRGLTLDLTDFWAFPTTPFAPELVGHVRRSVERRGLSHRDIVSGAGHDAVYVARKVPTAMIFIPCENGLSHNEAENIRPEHAASGCAVLADAVLATAG
ncbi:N-carbamoyl-L-amino-acid hydrolase [Azospirillum brasilense]|uniref:N-carbamoyl-L-amino-acid hydrolase n=1 Tax=Azospirillum brasilense TaxID=192 RepID=A0A560BJL8_AZOBR|nr:Zn-dependent hydrolase [Azospirillum brasilense]TWA72807.1 N-carbamoyl-L-amino-acid hydrolase [Azospirillum brasilense]